MSNDELREIAKAVIQAEVNKHATPMRGTGYLMCMQDLANYLREPEQVARIKDNEEAKKFIVDLLDHLMASLEVQKLTGFTPNLKAL